MKRKVVSGCPIDRVNSPTEARHFARNFAQKILMASELA